MKSRKTLKKGRQNAQSTLWENDWSHAESELDGQKWYIGRDIYFIYQRKGTNWESRLNTVGEQGLCGGPVDKR